MLLSLFLCRSKAQTRGLMVAGASVLLALAVALVVIFLRERALSDAAMLFTYDAVWYPAFNIHYAIGVDGISVMMILLSAVIVFTDRKSVV